MHARFEQRIEEGLRRIAATFQRLSPAVVGQRVGRLLGRNSRAAGLFATGTTPVRPAVPGPSRSSAQAPAAEASPWNPSHESLSPRRICEIRPEVAPNRRATLLVEPRVAKLVAILR